IPAPRRRTRPPTSRLSARRRRITRRRMAWSVRAVGPERAQSCSDGPREDRAGGSPPGGEGFLPRRVDAHGLHDARDLEDGAHVLLQAAEPDVASCRARLLHGRNEGAHPRAVDVADVVQVDEEAGLAVVEQPRERVADVRHRSHVQVAARDHHRYSTRLRYVDVHVRSHAWSVHVLAPPEAAAGPWPARYLTMVHSVPCSRATSMERLSANGFPKSSTSMTRDSSDERTETLMGWPPFPPYACWMELAHSSPTARSRLGCSCLGTPWPISSSRSHLRRRRRCSASLVMEKVLPVAFEVIGACSPAARSAFGVDEHGHPTIP